MAGGAGHARLLAAAATSSSRRLRYFLTDAQRQRDPPGCVPLICAEVGYEGAARWNSCSRAERSLFLEVNTRLQVEHPVTELVTGIDIVKTQIMVAAGEAAVHPAVDIQLHGHAIRVPM